MGNQNRSENQGTVMKYLNALTLAFAILLPGSVFAADPESSAGGVSVGDVPKAQPAQCPCGKNPDGTIKWCPCGTEGSETPSETISTTAIVTGVAVAGAIGLAAGHSSSTTQH
jgi:hypothetical protein